ncbi:MAG TPA: hypothetical protein VJ836_04460 [Candidatus Saccharimonadales bacterium]|nr:hypothetical protein [Candidatus Saccharimonadales bacterium]
MATEAEHSLLIGLGIAPGLIEEVSHLDPTLQVAGEIAAVRGQRPMDVAGGLKLLAAKEHIPAPGSKAYAARVRVVARMAAALGLGVHRPEQTKEAPALPYPDLDDEDLTAELAFELATAPQGDDVEGALDIMLDPNTIGPDSPLLPLARQYALRLGRVYGTAGGGNGQ